MSMQLLAAFLAFAVVALFTPGPNNVMLMASGLNYGAQRTIPHMAGVAFGFAFMVFVVGLGFGAVFSAWPALYTVLKFAGAAYLIYLAWEIARAGPPDAGKGARGKPLTIWQAAAFQWVNPKGWVIAVGTVTAYASLAEFPANIVLMAAILCAVGIASSATWVMFGTTLRRFVHSPRAVRVFNVTMAVLLVASLYPVFAGH